MKSFKTGRMIFFKLVLLSAFFINLISSCSTASAQEFNLKDNEALKENVFEQILNDRSLFNDLMSKIRENERAMQWMTSDRPMMLELHKQHHVESMMKKHPEMREQLMYSMMQTMQKDSAMHIRMHHMMLQNQQMRERMMQYMMNRMEEDPEMYNRMERMMEEHRKGHMRKGGHRKH